MKDIVKPANPIWEQRMTCPECETAFTAEVCDLRQERKQKYDQRDGAYTATVYYVACPECSHHNEVNDRGLSRAVIRKVPAIPCNGWNDR
jgi:uncharacterized protein (DUF2225 family)